MQYLGFRHILALMKYILLSVLLCASSHIFATGGKYGKSREMGICLGTAYYIGDLNPHAHFGTRLNIGGGLMYRDNLSTRWSIKGSLLYGRVEAYDADSDDPWQQNRNLSFRNDLLEFSMVAELNYFDYQIGDERNGISPYLFLGISYFSMRPEAEYNGNWYELQPLGTEGQGTTEGGSHYKTNGIAIPMGLGLKVNLFSIMAINLDWGMRKTWTDYFDDVSSTYIDPGVLQSENGQLAALLSDRSILQDGTQNDNAGLQRGDPGRKDWYSFAQMTLSFRLGKAPTSCWRNIDFR
jgi:hypothetical protein